MKKLLLVVGLIVFLTPMVVSAKNFLKPISLDEVSPVCKNSVDEFGIDCTAYVVKLDIACYSKPKLKSKRCYIKTFGKRSQSSPAKIGRTNFGAILTVYSLYKITEIQNINNQKWIKVCPYGSDDGIELKSRGGEAFERCGWTNNINKFYLASSILLDFLNTNIIDYIKTMPENADECSLNFNLGVIKKDCLGQSTPMFDSMAIALGCGIKRKDVEDCVRRYLPSVMGTGPISTEQLELIMQPGSGVMYAVIEAITERNRQQNQSQNQEPSEEEKQQALAQQNATGQANWKTTSGGIGYWDYGNGFGWAPPNPIRDKIIQGLSISQRTKNMLKTGSKGRTIFITK